MLPKDEFIKFSIEINLFFQRIMKEHLFFIETNLQPNEISFINQARRLKHSYNELLAESTYYANGVVSESSINAKEFVTPYTLKAEELNSMLTGAKINTDITKKEYQITHLSNNNINTMLEDLIKDLNERTHSLVEKTISFQKKLLLLVSDCKIFITLYPKMLEHNTEEAEYYYAILTALLEKKLPDNDIGPEITFWNHIMQEHAQFIDGMLDPSEKNLKETAENISHCFENLVKESIHRTEGQIIFKSIAETQKIQDFKITATKEILDCNLKSIIPPLLADHVLREANHYLKLLKRI